MVKFPNETHELSRAGQPWHRVERLQHLVGWFDRWLMGVAKPEYDVAPSEVPVKPKRRAEDEAAGTDGNVSPSWRRAAVPLSGSGAFRNAQRVAAAGMSFMEAVAAPERSFGCVARLGMTAFLGHDLQASGLPICPECRMSPMRLRTAKLSRHRAHHRVRLRAGDRGGGAQFVCPGSDAAKRKKPTRRPATRCAGCSIS